MKKVATSRTARITAATISHVRLNPPVLSTARIVATSTVQSRAIGISRFQPKCMNWS
jgi:hypothetical protein